MSRACPAAVAVAVSAAAAAAAPRLPARRRAVPLYGPSLHQAIDELLPVQVLPAQWGRKERKWKDRQVALLALLVGWDDGATAADRFESARRCLAAFYPTRQRPGSSYNGFMNALGKYSECSLAQLQAHLRRQMRRRLGGPDESGRHWLYKGKWVLLAADGSKFDAPDTLANEKGLGTSGRKKGGAKKGGRKKGGGKKSAAKTGGRNSGRKKSGRKKRAAKTGAAKTAGRKTGGRGASVPQQYLTVLYHLTSGLPWAWVRDGALGSERHHLRGMIPLLPDKTLLVADAGFVGYDLLKSLLDAGKDFLIRVGANVNLLKKLGHVREHQGTVYLWPEGKQKQDEPPLVLRLVRLVKGRGARRRYVYLLTSVTDRRRLSDKEAGRVYKMRWAVEVMYRALKKSLGRRKMLSASPARAALELDWAVMSMWVLGLLCAGEQGRTRAGPGYWSPAEALRAARRAIDRPGDKCPGGIGRQLRLAVRAKEDPVRPAEAKRARHRRDKKKDKPPGKPKARRARKKEVEAAKRLWEEQQVT